MAHYASIPVLAYHSNNVSDNSYGGNDHVALEADLHALHDAGWRCIGLDEVLDWHQGIPISAGSARPLALTFDDGSDFDFHDLDHPHCGPQRSLFNVIRDFSLHRGVSIVAASFVIASPQARTQLDERSLIGRGWWNDAWWAQAQASGLLSIESHSWDHLHPVLDETAHSRGEAGNFFCVDNFEDAELQIRQAAEYLSTKTGGYRPQFFAYPWGQVSNYLAEEYFPAHQERHGHRAAFTTEQSAVTRDHNRWRLPRLVCGEHWKSSQELIETLNMT